MGLFGGLVTGDSLVQKENMEQENQGFKNALSQQQIERNDIELDAMRRLAAQDQAAVVGLQNRRRNAIGNALRSLWDMSRGNGMATLTPSQLKRVAASDPDYFRGLTGIAFGDNDTGRGKKGKIARLQFGDNAIDLNEDQMGKITGMSYKDYLSGLKMEDELKTSELKRQQMMKEKEPKIDWSIGKELLDNGQFDEAQAKWFKNKYLESLGYQPEQTPDEAKTAKAAADAELRSRGIDPDMGIVIDKDGMTGSAYTNIGNGETLGFMLNGKSVNLKKGDTFESNGKKWRWNGGGSGRDTFADVTNEVVAPKKKIVGKKPVVNENESVENKEPNPEPKKSVSVDANKPYSDEQREKRFQEFKNNRKAELEKRNAMRNQYVGGQSEDVLESDEVLRQLFEDKEFSDLVEEEEARAVKEQSDKSQKAYLDMMRSHFMKNILDSKTLG